jgi:hypothetical protein
MIHVAHTADVDPATLRSARALLGDVFEGAFEDADWEPRHVQIEPGQLIVTYTDGVTEAEGPDGRFGEDRLREGLKGLASPAGTVRAVEQALEAFTSGQLRDDAAIVAIMRDTADLMLADEMPVLGQLDVAAEAEARA